MDFAGETGGVSSGPSLRPRREYTVPAEDDRDMSPLDARVKRTSVGRAHFGTNQVVILEIAIELDGEGDERLREQCG
jgi:hypothetical protein